MTAERASTLQHGAAVTAPAHVAIVMDGNGRWAEARGQTRRDGHLAGVKAARRAVEAARDLGLRYLTLYSFSTENWRRPPGEIRYLMELLRQFIIDDLPRLKKERVKVRILGDRKNLDADLRLLVRRAENETKDNSAFFLQIAFNYGGRDEIMRAALAAARDIAAKKVSGDALSEEAFSGYLDTAGLPDPDLVIRTSGEKRISNFLLWQAAYSEYVFLETLWPDFDQDVFSRAIEEFRGRERRFGGVGPS
ncbi:MAG: polyprenyl diphosphate synthase [Pseudomonadota bacterium]